MRTSSLQKMFSFLVLSTLALLIIQIVNEKPQRYFLDALEWAGFTIADRDRLFNAAVFWVTTITYLVSTSLSAILGWPEAIKDTELYPLTNTIALNLGTIIFLFVIRTGLVTGYEIGKGHRLNSNNIESFSYVMAWLFTCGWLTILLNHYVASKSQRQMESSRNN